MKPYTKWCTHGQGRGRKRKITKPTATAPCVANKSQQYSVGRLRPFTMAYASHRTMKLLERRQVLCNNTRNSPLFAKHVIFVLLTPFVTCSGTFIKEVMSFIWQSLGREPFGKGHPELRIFSESTPVKLECWIAANNRQRKLLNLHLMSQ